MNSAHPTRGWLAPLAIVLSFTIHTPVTAAECKGMSESACSNNTACHWVDGYTRKDGIKVKAHCRTGSSKKSAAVKKSPAKKE